ncbi:MAG: sulfur carrier protein ThiS, partial [Candidatus Sulfotelmatobacter sp.]
MCSARPHAKPEPGLNYEISFTMNLHINGEEHSFADPGPTANFTLASLIESLAMKPDRVAVELNRDIVPRDRWTHTHL